MTARPPIPIGELRPELLAAAVVIRAVHGDTAETLAGALRRTHRHETLAAAARHVVRIIDDAHEPGARASLAGWLGEDGVDRLAVALVALRAAAELAAGSMSPSADVQQKERIEKTAAVWEAAGRRYRPLGPVKRSRPPDDSGPDA